MSEVKVKRVPFHPTSIPNPNVTTMYAQQAQYPSNQYGGVSVGTPYQGGIPSQSGVPYYGGVPSQPQIYSGGVPSRPQIYYGGVPSQAVTPYNGAPLTYGAQPVIVMDQRPNFPPCKCCGCSPESGAKIFFTADAILSTITAIGSVALISAISQNHTEWTSIVEDSFCFAGSSWLTAYGLEAASDVIYAIGSIITVIGIFSRKKEWLYAYPIGLAFRLLLSLIACILTLHECGKYSLAVGLGLNCLWYIYALWVAYCFGDYLKRGGQTGGNGMYQYQTSPLPLGSTGTIPNPTVPQAVQPRQIRESDSDDD